MGRLAHDDTSYSKDFYFLLLCPLDHIPGVVGIVGMPLHCFHIIIVGWLLMRPPILHLKNHRIVSNHIDIFFLSFSFILYSTSYLYIDDGSTLLKSRDGRRSMNISIGENMPLFLFNNNIQREL